MTRPFALAGVLLALAMLLVTLVPEAGAAPPQVRDLGGATGARCDLATAGREALRRLHEPSVELRVRQLPDGAGGAAGRERVSIAADLPCSMVWGVVAHEPAHVRQIREVGPGLYAKLGGDAAELGADCAAARTGWLRAERWPYLAARRAHGGPAGCTAAEQITARLLASDW